MQSLWPLIEFGNIITSQKGEVIEQGCDLCTHSLDFLESLDFQSFMFWLSSDLDWLSKGF